MFSSLRKKRAHHQTAPDSRAEARDEDVRKEGRPHPDDGSEDVALAEEIIARYIAPNLVPRAKILEIGCGRSQFSEKLADLGGDLLCADVSPEMLRRTGERLNVKKGVAFQKLSGHELRRFEPGIFEIVFSFDAFSHFSMDEAYSYLGEVRRVLKPGGKGLLRFANLSSPEGWQRFVGGLHFHRGKSDDGIRSGFLTWEIVELFLASLGFEILDRCKEPWQDILVLFRKPA